MNRPLPVVSACALCLLAGCASVTVRKVPSPAQYLVNGQSQWTAQDQRRADEMEGIRFYLPRPFVTVFESFPVATDVYLALGRVSPDGKYVAIDSVAPLGTRDDVINPKATRLASEISIPENWIFSARRLDAAPPAGDMTGAGGTPQSGDATTAQPAGGDALSDQTSRLLSAARELTGKANSAAASAEDAAKGARRSAAEASSAAREADAAASPDSPVRTGINKRNVTNNNGAFAYQPLRGSFDIIYLPDFDEQYVVSSKAGLGNAEFQLNLGQGWSLQGFNSLSDNSELNKRIFDVIDAGIELAKKTATGLLGSVFPPALAGLATPQAGEGEKLESPGTPVALKIVVVHYAAKGLYPVIKPRELMNRSGPGLVVNVADSQGRWTPLSDVDIRGEVNRMESMQRRSTIPIYPYQYVSFNTFQYMAIEVLTPEGLPFGTLYDKTGTTGEPGGARMSDEAVTKFIESFKKLGTPVMPEVPQFAWKYLESSVLDAANVGRPGTFTGAIIDERGTGKLAITLKPKPATDLTEGETNAIAKSIRDRLNTIDAVKKHWSGGVEQVTVGYAN